MAGHGSFIWYELMTPDPKAAVDFYTGLVGWGIQALENLETPYTMFTAGDEPVGGVMQLPEEAAAGGSPPHWVSYVAVDNVDATIARASDLGATVYVAPQDIPEIGRFSVFADPQGAVIAVYKSFVEHEKGPLDTEALGRFSWHELATSDHAAGFDFYNALFGWQVIEDMDMGGGFVYRIYGREGAPPLGGMFTKPAEMPGPPAWLYYVNVDNVSKSAEAVTSAGGKVLNGPMEVPGGTFIAQCMDPQGAVFALHSKTNG